jgi:hypothetical protein
VHNVQCDHTTFSTSNPVPKNIKNKWGVDGNVTLGKLNYRRVVCFLQIPYLISCASFSTNCVYEVSYFACQTSWGNEISNTSWLQTLSVQIHILGSGPDNKFQGPTKMILQGESHTVKPQFNFPAFSNVFSCPDNSSIYTNKPPFNENRYLVKYILIP